MIKGVLFDKDGTLIDFFSLWLQAALDAVPEFLRLNGLKQELADYILQTIGVEKEKVDPKGALAYKSYAEIAGDIRRALLVRGIDLDEEMIRGQIEELFNKSVTGRNASYRQFTDIGILVDRLKAKNIYVGLATADTMISALNCLRTLGTLEKFDYIGADDGTKRPKPEPDMFREFQSKFHLEAGEIAVVGDTYNDMIFAAQNVGIAIGVLSGVSEKADFQGAADYIIGSIQELPEVLDMM